MAAESWRHPGADPPVPGGHPPGLRSSLGEEAWGIVVEALASLSSDTLHERYARESTYEGVSRVFTVATGKAAAGATAGLRRGVPDRLLRGGVLVDHVGGGQVPPVPGVVPLRGDHPLPGPRSLHAADRLREVVRSWHLAGRDLVLVSVSGGTSSLIASPRSPVTLEDLRSLGDTLLRSGADVTQVNSVRRRVGLLHDGGLLRALRPARVRTVVVSDVAQHGVAGVGSGPTLPDAGTVPPEVLRLIEDPALRGRVTAAMDGAVRGQDTSDEVLVLAGMEDYTRSCALVAERRGWVSAAPRPVVQGSWSEVADGFWAEALALSGRVTAGRRLAVVGCGECTVSVRPGGRGGRCQQVALAVAARAPRGVEFAFAAFASDGRDNIEGVHGAVVDSGSAAALRRRGAERALGETDTHDLLRGAGCLVTGGPTGENLGDGYVLCLRVP